MIANTEFRNRHGERLDAELHPSSKDHRLVLLGHGVTGNKDRPLLVAVAEGLAARGWPCLRFSFPGNGESGGEFAEATVTKEAEDLRDLVAAIPGDVRIAYCGHSMGGAVGLLAAEQEPRLEVLIQLAGMVRTEAFCEREFGDVVPDAGNMWDEEGCPLSRNYVDDMESIGDLFDEVRSLGRPILFLHGLDDDVVLPADSEDAFAVAAEPKRLVCLPGEGHMFSDASCERLVEEMVSWLQEHLAS
jgi:pimeloyl-ACP methyl ester carboxylesterase